MREVGDLVNETRTHQIKAEEAKHQGNSAPRLETWSTNDPATLSGRGCHASPDRTM